MPGSTLARIQRRPLNPFLFPVLRGDPESDVLANLFDWHGCVKNLSVYLVTRRMPQILLFCFSNTPWHTHTHPQGHWESNSCQMAVAANLTSLISGGVSQPVSQPSPLGRYDSHSQWDVIRPVAGLARCFLLWRHWQTVPVIIKQGAPPRPTHSSLMKLCCSHHFPWFHLLCIFLFVLRENDCLPHHVGPHMALQPQPQPRRWVRVTKDSENPMWPSWWL